MNNIKKLKPIYSIMGSCVIVYLFITLTQLTPIIEYYRSNGFEWSWINITRILYLVFIIICIYFNVIIMNLAYKNTLYAYYLGEISRKTKTNSDRIFITQGAYNSKSQSTYRSLVEFRNHLINNKNITMLSIVSPRLHVYDFKKWYWSYTFNMSKTILFLNFICAVSHVAAFMLFDNIIFSVSTFVIFMLLLIYHYFSSLSFKHYSKEHKEGFMPIDDIDEEGFIYSNDTPNNKTVYSCPQLDIHYW